MGFLEERDLKDVPTIPEFFRGKSIFITGGTGFMGKVLIEKLLYSCTDLHKIYLLLRSKKGTSPEERMENLYNTPCFDRLRKDRPGAFESKVALLAGDISQVGLGLSPEDRELIINKVNIIFHVAASVRFDDPLPVAVSSNITSTTTILEIAKEIKNLVVLVHVSTAYSNSEWNPVEEAMYPPYADWRDTVNICKNVDEKTLNILTPKYLGEIPNTYVLTKQLAEHAIYEQRGKLPIVITRPSVVTSSMKEPMPGWVANFNGPLGFMIGVGTGILRCTYLKKDISLNVIPVDVCIRHFIAAAWIRGTKKLDPLDDIEIYNSCGKEKITYECLKKIGMKLISEIPFENSLWTISCTYTTSRSLYYLNVLIKHVLPALLIDTILWLSGKKPLFLKIHRKIYNNNLATQKFMLNEWTFAMDNFDKLCSCLKEGDMFDFNYDLNFFTEKYYMDGLCACKKYLLKETDENLPKAKARMKRINMLDKIIRFAVYGTITWATITSTFVQSIINYKEN